MQFGSVDRKGRFPIGDQIGHSYAVEKVFEAHRISHHPTRHTITPYNSSDAGLTATMLLPLLLLLLLTTTRRGTSCSPPASSAYRHPMAAVRVIDDLFAIPLLAAAVLALETLDEVERQNRDDEAGEGSPCAKRTLCSRKRRDEDVCLSTAGSSTQTPHNPRAGQDNKQFRSTDFRLPYFPRIKRS